MPFVDLDEELGNENVEETESTNLAKQGVCGLKVHEWMATSSSLISRWLCVI